jgi:flagellar assembly factor FliW
MKINTPTFGEVDVDENNIISFANGILGFDELKKYIVLSADDEDTVFYWLQSVEEPEISFIVTNPFLFIQNYEFDIPETVVKQLELENQEDLIVYSITVITENIKNATINLKGPVLVNSKNKKAKQIVLDGDEYPLKYKIFKEEKK